jgi:hypothetical protein
MPVQRLPRYEMLLKELRKQTPVEHPDYRVRVCVCACVLCTSVQSTRACVCITCACIVGHLEGGRRHASSRLGMCCCVSRARGAALRATVHTLTARPAQYVNEKKRASEQLQLLHAIQSHLKPSDNVRACCVREPECLYVCPIYLCSGRCSPSAGAVWSLRQPSTRAVGRQCAASARCSCSMTCS